jgi:hypothetical protein
MLNFSAFAAIGYRYQPRRGLYLPIRVIRAIRGSGKERFLTTKDMKTTKEDFSQFLNSPFTLQPSLLLALCALRGLEKHFHEVVKQGRRADSRVDKSDIPMRK